MSDAPREEDLEVRELLSRSPLALRLLGRRDAPLGVIDVRHAQALHARLAGWLAQRLGLLESLTARYRGGEAGPHAGLAFVLADAHRTRPDDYGGGLLPAHASAPGVPAVFNTFVSAAAPLPEPQTDAGTRRVRRAGSTTTSKAHTGAAGPVPETSMRRDPSTTTVSGPTHVGSRAPAHPTLDETASDLPVHTHGRATTGREPRRADAGSRASSDSQTTPAGDAPQPPTADARRPLAPSTSRELPAGVRTTPEEFAPPELRHTPPPFRAAPSDAVTAPAPPAGQTAEPVPRSAAASVLPQTFAAGRDSRAPIPAPGQTPSASELPPDARGHGRTPLPLARAFRTAETPAGARVPPRTSAAEVPAGVSGGAAQEMVWHASPTIRSQADRSQADRSQADAGGTVHGGDGMRAPHAGGSDTRRASADDVGADVATPGAARVSRAGRVEEIDVEGLTERVSRMISRQLIVERERRGFKG